MRHSDKHEKYPTFEGHKIPDRIESPITVNTFLVGCDYMVDNLHKCAYLQNWIPQKLVTQATQKK